MVGVQVLAVRCSASTLTSAPLWCAHKKVGALRSHSDKLAPKASLLVSLFALRIIPTHFGPPIDESAQTCGSVATHSFGLSGFVLFVCLGFPVICINITAGGWFEAQFELMELKRNQDERGAAGGWVCRSRNHEFH